MPALESEVYAVRVERMARWLAGTTLAARGRERLLRVLAELTDDQLERLERGVRRELLLRGLALGLPTRFNAARAAGLHARIEARFPHPDGRDPDRYEIQIAGGRCVVRRGVPVDPDVTCTIGLADLLRLTRGSTTLPVLWVSGNLTLDGDPYILWKLPDLFSGRAN